MILTSTIQFPDPINKTLIHEEGYLFITLKSIIFQSFSDFKSAYKFNYKTIISEFELDENKISFKTKRIIEIIL